MSPTENRQIADLKEIIEDLAKLTTKIDVSLVGNEYTEHKGLIHKVAELDKRLNTIEKTLLIFKSKWAAIVMALVGLSGFAALIYYVTSIFHNLSKLTS